MNRVKKGFLLFQTDNEKIGNLSTSKSTTPAHTTRKPCQKLPCCAPDEKKIRMLVSYSWYDAFSKTIFLKKSHIPFICYPIPCSY